MELVEVFGAVSVAAMALFYALEERSPWFVLLFAAACLASGANASWEPAKRWDLHAASGARLLRGRGNYGRCDEGVQRVLGALSRGAQPGVGGRSFVAMSLFFYAVHFAQVSVHEPSP